MVKQRKTNEKPPISPTAARREELREALLAAVDRTVLAEGYQALRARDLAREVGCAVGAIYNAFPDLDALIFAAKGRTLDLLDRELARAVAAVPAAGSGGVDLASRQLLEWHRAGADVQARMPLLSAYLGHVSPAGTYWYLTAVPELMELAAARLAQKAPR